MPVVLLGQKITLRALKNEKKDKMKIKRKNENTEDFLYSFPEERKIERKKKKKINCHINMN